MTSKGEYAKDPAKYRALSKAWRDANVARSREIAKESYRRNQWKRLASAHNISESSYLSMLVQQDYACDICNEPFEDMAIGYLRRFA